jgi:hypothetical protein
VTLSRFCGAPPRFFAVSDIHRHPTHFRTRLQNHEFVAFLAGVPEATLVPKPAKTTNFSLDIK